MEFLPRENFTLSEDLTLLSAKCLKDLQDVSILREFLEVKPWTVEVNVAAYTGYKTGRREPRRAGI